MENKQKDMVNKISDMLDDFNRKESLEILAAIVMEYDLEVAANLIKKDCDLSLRKADIEDCRYREGNECAGATPLLSLLSDIETIINCDDDLGNFKINYPVREMTAEEMEAAGYSKNVTWFTEDETIQLNNVLLEFELY